MDLAKKKIGIWGYGVTGKSAIPFFKQIGCQVGLVEKKTLTAEEQEQISRDNVTLWPYEQLEQFLAAHDAIFTSGSIDLRPYSQFAHKWLSEVDIIQQYAGQRLGNPKVIAITGTVGKTTVTRLLTHVLRYAGYQVAASGNVGSPSMRVSFDLLIERAKIDYLILELSSYQLEISKTFAPDVAILTNFYPNHLDRHGTEQAYFDAKARLFIYQTPEQYAVLPMEFRDRIVTKAKVFGGTKYAFSINNGDSEGRLPSAAVGRGVRGGNGPLAHSPLRSFDQLRMSGLKPTTDDKIFPIINDAPTYPENIAIIENILQALQLDPHLLTQASATFERDEHRLEKVATINGVEIYNDSKSTVPQATIAAVQALQHKPIILLLGGVSKGVDRSSLMDTIKQTCKTDCIKTVICFGGEAEQLLEATVNSGVMALRCSTLEEAWAQALKLAQPGDQVLLSPAGASYDLFKDYQERGTMFKKLVHQSQQEKGSL